MKIEVDHHDRAALANLCRAKSMTADENSRETKSDRQRVEYEQESRYFEELAIRLDNGEQLQLDPKTPIIANPRIDLDQVDAPKPAVQPEAEQRPRTHTRTPRSEGAKGQEAAGEA